MTKVLRCLIPSLTIAQFAFAEDLVRGRIESADI